VGQVHLIVLGMGANKPDKYSSGPENNAGNEPVFIAADVEDVQIVSDVVGGSE